MKKKLNAYMVAGFACLNGTALPVPQATAQAYPGRPVRIVTSEAGGANDFTARLIGQGISGPLGQPVIIDNRPTLIAGEFVSKSQPDGYTILVAGTALWIGPLLEKAPYDPVKDFSPITLAASSPNVLVVHPSVPVGSVKELITLAKAKPGFLNYASGASGAGNHLATELFKSMAGGINIVRIPYKGGAQSLTDLVGGRVQLMFGGATLVGEQIKQGKLKGLAVTSAQPSALFPGLPTVSASLPGYEASAMTGIFAPVGTPGTIVNRLNQEIVRVLSQADVKQKFLNSRIETAGTTPEDFAIMMKSEMDRMGKVIRDAGIRAE